MGRLDKLLTEYHRNAASVSRNLRINGKAIDVNMVWQVLIYEMDHADIPTDVILAGLSVEEMERIIISFFQRNGLPLAEVFSNINSYLEEDGIEKADVKSNGELWTVHLNDLDPFPSSPHAHNYSKHLKLHLGNGGLYRKTKLIGKMPKKELNMLREKIKLKLPDLMLPQLIK